MPEPRRIAIATFGRSDFSILRPLYRRLDAESSFDVGFWVAGAHLDEASGRTLSDIEQAGVTIWAQIDSGTYDRSAIGTVQVMASQMTGFAAVTSGTCNEAGGSGPIPDLVLILGDRFEAVSAGLAMVPLGIPVGHISGGSITEGAIDDVFRHCLSKIAAIHFCELARFAQRIQFMGECPERIITTGALGLDAFVEPMTLTFDNLVDAFDLEGLRPGFVLATLHPESRTPGATAPMARAMVDALLETGRQVVLTYPNADPGSEVVIETIESVADHPDVYLVRGFGADWYPIAMTHAGLMVGNSSGGIIEAATFELPVVDIGDRQKGRERGPNVVHSRRDRDSIVDAIDRATDPAFIGRAGAGNIYGDGRASERVVAALKALDWTTLGDPKRFADPDPGFAGTLLELR